MASGRPYVLYRFLPHGRLTIPLFCIFFLEIRHGENGKIFTLCSSLSLDTFCLETTQKKKKKMVKDKYERHGKKLAVIRLLRKKKYTESEIPNEYFENRYKFNKKISILCILIQKTRKGGTLLVSEIPADPPIKPK